MTTSAYKYNKIFRIQPKPDVVPEKRDEAALFVTVYLKEPIVINGKPRNKLEAAVSSRNIVADGMVEFTDSKSGVRYAVPFENVGCVMYERLE